MPVRRAVFAAIGLALVPLGAAGLVLPLLPGTPILIVAAACLARASPRLEAWLVDHPRLGPGVRAWRERGAIPRNAKRVALPVMAVSGLIAAASSAPLFAKLIAVVALAAAGLWVWSRPEA
ncbi:DUF454 domain-containing protein [Marinicauda salina]|uniref:DUF454 domain-containing protein n=1 Tax=Marinicauda salina TaxID=2135793 RepID=A0A2U2BY05_9PROT|nr:YbaN family protein [Marinicauda salina]PWE18903.1 DUF454 domain-containing protein [Marinicauda salina]